MRFKRRRCHLAEFDTIKTNLILNRFIRIAPNGRISYSQRLTIKASCQMNLRKFPLDSQSCPLLIGSFGHDTGDIVYRVRFIWGRV